MHGTGKRILVVEGNAKRGSDAIVAVGGTPYAEAYADLLKVIAPGLETAIVRPADDGPEYPLDGYDAVAWTGSALNAYDTIPEVTNQLKLAERVMAAGLPVFGSCWGLQVFVTALGGKIRRNPKGREVGIAEAITLTEAGHNHPMYKGKGDIFEAYAVHQDDTETLPAGAIVLAENAMSPVQALAYEQGGVSFWGVQYHPEFDAPTMARTYTRLARVLVQEGLVTDEHEAHQLAADYNTPHHTNPNLHNDTQRARELVNWIADKVL